MPSTVLSRSITFTYDPVVMQPSLTYFPAWSEGMMELAIGGRTISIG